MLIGRFVATCGAMVVVAGTFLPWLRSGERRRSSYEILSLVDRLGYSSSGAVGWGLRLWPTVPLLLVAAVALLWFEHRRLAVGAGVVVGAYAGAVAAAVRSASPAGIVTVQYGSWITLIGAIVLLIGLLPAIWSRAPEAA